MKQTFHSIIEKLSEKYSVQPILPESATFIFILESPHVHELKYRAPVAGSSGKTMASILLGKSIDKPLGLLVKQNIELGNPYETLNKIGIMNVSNIPLQRKAYASHLVQQYEFFFQMLEKLRTSNHRIKYSSNDLNDLQNVLLTRFNQQLKRLIDRNCTLVPCGRFAQKFLNLSTIRDKKWNIIYDVPHPSYNSWNQKRYQQKITELQKAFIGNELGSFE